MAATEDLGITRDPGLDNEVAPRSRWRRQTRPRRQHSLQVREVSHGSFGEDLVSIEENFKIVFPS